MTNRVLISKMLLSLKRSSALFPSEEETRPLPSMGMIGLLSV